MVSAFVLFVIFLQYFNLTYSTAFIVLVVVVNKDFLHYWYLYLYRARSDTVSVIQDGSDTLLINQQVGNLS